MQTLKSGVLAQTRLALDLRLKNLNEGDDGTDWAAIERLLLGDVVPARGAIRRIIIAALGDGPMSSADIKTVVGEHLNANHAELAPKVDRALFRLASEGKIEHPSWGKYQLSER